MKTRLNSFMAPVGIIVLVLISLHVSVSICQSYTLTITPKPTNGTVTSDVGGINCGAAGSYCTSTNLPLNTPVTLQATPISTSYDFTSWTIDGATSTNNPLTFNMPSASISGSATFVPHFPTEWAVEVVDAPKYFNNSYSRSITTEKSTNLPHVVYGGDRLYHAYHNGLLWQLEVVDNAPFTGEFASSAMDGENNLHIAYYDVSKQDLKYATNATGAWITTTIDSAGDVGQYNSIAVDSNGKVHISYYDATNQDLKYASNASGSWSTTTVVISGSDEGKFSSLAVDKDNNVHISFYNSYNRELHYATNTPGYWWWCVVDSSWVGQYTSIAVDTDKVAHISYYDSLNYRVKYATGSQTSWTKTIIDDTYIGELSYTSLALDSAGKVHVSYYDKWNMDLKYATNASGAWSNTTVDSSDMTGEFNSIAVDGNDQVHISYYDATDRSLRYTTKASGSWSYAILDYAGDVGADSSLARDAAGKDHISYYDVKNRVLKYATNSSGSWVTSIIDQVGDVGRYSSIAVDSGGKVHISYHDGTNQKLKYATNSSGAWVTTVIDGTVPAGLYSSLGIDSGDNLHICYVNGATQAIVNYATNASGSWTAAVIDGSAGTKQGLSITVDVDRNVHVGYVSGLSVSYATNASGNWITQSVDTDPNWYRSLTSIGLDPFGKAHVSYYRQSLYGPLYQYQIVYSTNASGSWTYPYPVDDVGYNPAHSSLKADSTGKVRISYYDSGQLKFATNAGGMWQSYVVDNSGDVGDYSSLSIDPVMAPHISYYDARRHALKYASKPDLTAPIGSVEIPYYSLSQSTSLSLTCTDADGSGCFQMRFSNDGASWSSPVAFAASSPWTLAPEDGLKTVYVQLRDSAGNWSAAMAATTRLDTTPPSGSIAINGDAAQTSMASVTLSLAAIDAVSGVSWMQFSSDNTNWTAAESYTSLKPWVLPAGAGMKTVYVKYGDAAGNWSGSFSDAIELVAGSGIVQSLDTGSTIVGRSSSIAVDGDGKVHISYHDSTNSTLKYATNVNGIWTYSVIGAVGGTSPCPSLKIDANNTAHVSYYYEVYDGGWIRELRYATNSSGAWVVTTIVSGNNAGEKNSLAVDHNNKVHVSYRTYDAFTGFYALNYATNASGFWVTTVIDSAGSVGQENAIAVDSNNSVHIAYSDRTNANLKYATKASGSWVTTTADSTAGVGSSVTVAVDPANKVHIAHLDDTNGNLKYTTNASGAWQSATIDSSATSPINASIGVDADGKVCIGYTVYDGSYTYVYSNYNYYTKLIANVSGSWVTSVVDTAVFPGSAMSLAVDAAKKVHMSYNDYGADDLRYAYVDPSVKPGIIINSGVPYANTVDATLDLSVSGLNSSRMHLSSDGLVWTTPEAYAATKAWTLAAGEGAKKVYAQFQDNAGDWSGVYSGTISLDMAAPEGTITINAGAPAADSRSVVLSLAAQDPSGIAEMQLGNASDALGASEPYAVSKAWLLPANDGLKTVYARFKDNAGYWSTVRTATIFLDYQETVTANSAGNGSGTVGSSAGGINYSYPAANTATVTLDRGTPVTLTATAGGNGATATWQDCAANGGAAGGTATVATCTFSSLMSSRTVTATFNPAQHTLSVNIIGSGSGSVLSTPAGIAGNVGSSAPFAPGTGVTLQALPAAYSFFANWSGDCTGPSNCSVVMDAARTVTATFDLDTVHKTRIGDTTNYASTLQAAYDAAPAGEKIKAWGTDFVEDFSCTQVKDVTLQGGYDSGYTNKSGFTTLFGRLIVKKGSIRVDRLIIRSN